MGNQIEISPRVGWRLIGDEVVAFNCTNQQIVIWNELASQLWELIIDGKELDQLIHWLSNEYSLDKQQAEQDIFHFLREANTMGFINSDHSEVEPIVQAFDDGENVLLAVEMMAIEHLIPFAVTFETTYACNEKCIHCYMDRSLPALRLFEIERILDEIAYEGCLFVSFTGGEFFVRKDSLKIIEHANKLHLVVDILSNGTLINQNIVETLAGYSVRRVQISLYGATPEIHDSITCLQGSFRKTLEGIELLKEADVKVEIAFPLMQQNFHERYAIKQLADSMDCLISPSHIITARNNGSQDTFPLRLNGRQFKEFLGDKKLSSLYAGRKPFQDHQFYFEFSDLLEAAPCYSGFNSCAITPSGKVVPCNQLLYEVGDLKVDSFSEIWHGSSQLQYLRNLKLRDLKKCAGCELLSFCTRCPGLALLEGGDLLGPSPENCRIARTIQKLETEGGERI